MTMEWAVSDKTSYYLIDPPVSAFSSKEEVEAWITELKDLPQDNAEVRFALRQAKHLLVLITNNGE